jgi:hypothetical protein
MQTEGGSQNIVKILVRETPQGSFFYDKFSVEVKSGFGAQFSNTENQTRAAGTETNPSIKIDDFISKVQEIKREEPFFQSSRDLTTKKGRILIKGLQRIIELGPKADVSTLIHESGHAWLEEMAEDFSVINRTAQENRTKIQSQFFEDGQTILDWLGVESFTDIKTEHHEKFAEGVESYFRSGKAPTKGLRKAFARFKLWLADIYRFIKNEELSPEVRGVFDRLIATPEKITEAGDSQSLSPLFSDAQLESFGLTGAEAERYKQAVDRAREAAEEKLLSKLMEDISKEKRVLHRGRRSKIVDDLEAQANEMRVFRALSILQRSKMPDGSDVPDNVKGLKISRESLLEDYDAEFLRRLPRPYVYGKVGLHHNMVAELLGYESGDQLLTELANSEKKNDWINRNADALMKDRYPELMDDPDQVRREAEEALHDEPLEKLIRMELEFLASNDLPALKDVIRKTVRRVPPEKAIKERAQAIIGSKVVTDVKPHIYLRAERKAAKEAGGALARGDFEAAFEAKRKELLNFELYRVARQAEKDLEKHKRLFRRFRDSDEKLAKTRDVDLINAGRSILFFFGLGKFDKAKSHMEKLKSYAPEVYERVQALVYEVAGESRSWKELKWDDYQELVDQIGAIWDLSKSTRRIELDGKKEDINNLKDQLIIKLDEMVGGKSRLGETGSVTPWEKTKVMLLGMKASLRRVEAWADAMDQGDEQGVFKRFIFQPIAEAADSYRSDKQAYLQKYLDIVKSVENSLTKEKIKSDELNFVFNGKAEILGALLHTGNASNFRKLMLGRGWGSLNEDGSVDISKWDAFIDRAQRDGIITKQDYDYVQNVWDLLEELKPRAQKAHKELKGYYFDEITAEEKETPFGTYRGGYVPAVVDPFASSDAAIRNERQLIDDNGGMPLFPSTGKGFTKGRVEYNAPLQLDVRFIPMHMDKVLRFVHLEPQVNGVARIITSKALRNRLDKLDPTIATDLLIPWLQRSALQKVETPSEGWGGKGADRVFKELRTRTGLNIMTANVVNTLQQVTGLSLAAVKVGPKHLRNALWEYVRSPKKFAEAINTSSSFMDQRIASQVFDIQGHMDDLLLNPTKYEKARNFAKKHGYFMQAGAQNVVDLIVWSGAYEQAIEQGSTEKDAIRAGDSAVKLTQGSFNAEDISRFETGTPFMRAFTMFYSYFNMQANLLGTEYNNIVRQMGLRQGAGRLAYLYVMGFMIPAVVAEMIVQTFSGRGFDEDDDDEYLDDFMALFFGSQLRTGAAFVPGVGPASMAMVNSFNDRWYDDRISTSPAVSMIEGAVSAPKSVYEALAEDGSKKRAARDLLSAVGLLTGLPVMPLSKPIGYMSEVEAGNTRPLNTIDLARGLVSGRNSE